MIVLTISAFAESQELSAVSSKDVFKELKINDAKESTAIFEMNSPVELSNEKLSFSFNEVCGKVRDYTVTVLDTCYRDEPVYKESIKESCYDDTENATYYCENKTISSIDYYEQIPYDCFKEVSSIPSGAKDYKIDADVEMAICADGNLGYRIDWIPSLEIDKDKILSMNDWAWWNASYNNKMFINISLLSSSVNFYVNGTSGVNINGTVIFPIARTTTGAVSLYYNTAADYVIVENDSSIQSVNVTGVANPLSFSKTSSGIASDSNFMGMKFTMSASASKIEVDKTAGTLCPRIRLYDSSRNTLAEVNSSSEKTNISYNMVSGTTYYIGFSNNVTGNCDVNYDATGSYPNSQPSLSWIAGWDTSSDSSSQANTIDQFNVFTNPSSKNAPSAGYGDVYRTMPYYNGENESEGRAAIYIGIMQSKIGSSYTPFEDQKLFERLLNGSQYNGTFDIFITSGNRRYAFNYDKNSFSIFPDFYNITPVLYVWQRINMTNYDIQSNVKSFIDSTYS